MLRCPSNECRQHEIGFMVIKTGYRLVYTNIGKFNLTKKDGTTITDQEDVESLLTGIDHYQMKCMKCGQKAKISSFHDAYVNPMKNFDTDNLCGCGGEIWNDFEVIQVKVDKEVWEDGDSQRSVPVGVKNTSKCDKCGRIFGKVLVEKSI